MDEIMALMRDVERFQTSVSTLSQGINGCGVDWRDPQYEDLKKLIGNIAKESKRTMISSNNAVRALQQFERAASED